MLQTENDLLHGQTPLAEHTRGVAQHEAHHQAPHQVPVIGVLTVSRTGLGGSQVLQGAKHTLHPTAPSPPAEPLWGAPRRLQTQERDTVLTRFIDNDHGHLARGRTGGTPPHVTSPSLPGVLLPAPPLALDQGVAFDLAPIGHGKARGLFALHAPSALMRIASMLHALRVAQPTIGHHHGGRQRQATPTTRCHALVAHQPGPVPQAPPEQAVAWPSPPARARAPRQRLPDATARPCPTTPACAGRSTPYRPTPPAPPMSGTPRPPTPRSTASGSACPGLCRAPAAS